MLTIPNILLLTAFITCLVSISGKCPLWVSVLLLIVWAFIARGF
jgi:hypothetical protein